jgi:hypothetical protein
MDHVLRLYGIGGSKSFPYCG